MVSSQTKITGSIPDPRQDRYPQGRILVAEDSLVQAEIIRRTLVKHGFTVEHVTNGAAGLARIKQASPDLVISDIVMPEMSGFELCRAIRREGSLRDLPIILLTSLSNLEDVLEGLEAGAFNFITKPYSEERLLAIVEEQLRKARHPEPKDTDGLLITCGGQKYVIREKPEKILDFFLSTYSIAIEKNLDLARAQEELRILNEHLEQAVQERALALIAESSQRQVAEEELDRSRRYQELILNAVGEGILGVDLEGRINFANPAAMTMLGYEAETITGVLLDRVCSFSLPDGSRFPAGDNPPAAIMRDGPGHTLAGVLHHRDGANFPGEGLCALINEGKEVTGAVITFRDITERKQADKALRKAFDGAAKALAHTVEARDPYTSGHQIRVASLACAVAREMGLSPERLEVLRIAAVLHDIGKIQIPAEILSKPTQLSNNEFELIKAHPQIGYDIIKTLNFPGQVADIVLQHHERIGGSGYPDGLSEGELLLESRILAVADVVEAMVSHRPYRPSLGIEKALGEITKNKDIHYDSEVVDACVKLVAQKEFTFE